MSGHLFVCGHISAWPIESIFGLIVGRFRISNGGALPHVTVGRLDDSMMPSRVSEITAPRCRTVRHQFPVESVWLEYTICVFSASTCFSHSNALTHSADRARNWGITIMASEQWSLTTLIHCMYSDEPIVFVYTTLLVGVLSDANLHFIVQMFPLARMQFRTIQDI